ncbi:MAG: TRAP transporter small permease [Alphaproteobacteria bacterium]|nr:TRAP transporter small permease [Alphaproteobacteria bacterium]
MLQKIDQTYTLLVRGLMILACVYLGMMMVVIVYYTTFRSLGWSYNRYSFVFIEYGFIYVLMAGCPWMVRKKAHVYIEMVTAALSDRVRPTWSRGVALLAALICAILAFYTGLLTYEDYSWNRFDELRGDLDIKRWVVIIAMPIGFGLSAIEFLRFVFGSEVIHVGEAGVHE